MRDRGEEGEKAALVGVVGNLFLASFKFAVGVLAGSTAVIADGFHSASDILTSALTWLGIRISRAPPDKEHPLGHGDVEPIVGLIVSILLVLVGFEFAKHSLSIAPKATPPGKLAIYATGIALVAKELMSRYTISVAEGIRSPALRADAQHHRSDVYTSLVVFFALLGALLGYPVLDPLAAFAISVVIVKMGFDVGRENILQLMGTVPSPDLGSQIEELVMGVEKVRLIHRVRIHGVGAYFNVDLHVAVDEDLPLGEAHRIAHDIQGRIVDAFPEIAYALVHIEPYDSHHERVHDARPR